MGIIADVIISDTGDFEELCSLENMNPENLVWEEIPALSVQKLVALLSVLGKASTFADFPKLYEESIEGPWVYRFPDSLVKLLSVLEDRSVQKIAKLWMKKEFEFAVERWPTEIVEQLLVKLRTLSQESLKCGKPLLLRLNL